MNAYTPGRAAKELGVSGHIIRRLCNSGLIEASKINGRLYVPLHVVERYKNKKEPLPEVPVEVGDSPEPEVRRGGRQPRRRFQEKLLQRRAEVEMAKLEADLAEQQDRKEERQRRKDKARAAERTEEDRQIEEASREEWVASWTELALDVFANDPPAELRLPIAGKIREALDQISPSYSYENTELVVSAATDKIMRPWLEQRREKNRKEQERARAQQAEQQYQQIRPILDFTHHLLDCTAKHRNRLNLAMTKGITEEEDEEG